MLIKIGSKLKIANEAVAFDYCICDYCRKPYTIKRSAYVNEYDQKIMCEKCFDMYFIYNQSFYSICEPLKKRKEMGLEKFEEIDLYRERPSDEKSINNDRMVMDTAFLENMKGYFQLKKSYFKGKSEEKKQQQNINLLTELMEISKINKPHI